MNKKQIEQIFQTAVEMTKDSKLILPFETTKARSSARVLLYNAKREYEKAVPSAKGSIKLLQTRDDNQKPLLVITKTEDESPMPVILYKDGKAEVLEFPAVVAQKTEEIPDRVRLQMAEDGVE